MMYTGEEKRRTCCNTTSVQYHMATCSSEANQEYQKRQAKVPELIIAAHEMELISAKVTRWEDGCITVDVEDFEKLLKAYME